MVSMVIDRFAHCTSNNCTCWQSVCHWCGYENAARCVRYNTCQPVRPGCGRHRTERGYLNTLNECVQRGNGVAYLLLRCNMLSRCVRVISWHANDRINYVCCALCRVHIHIIAYVQVFLFYCTKLELEFQFRIGTTGWNRYLGSLWICVQNRSWCWAICFAFFNPQFSNYKMYQYCFRMFVFIHSTPYMKKD